MVCKRHDAFCSTLPKAVKLAVNGMKSKGMDQISGRHKKRAPEAPFDFEIPRLLFSKLGVSFHATL